ncbi:arsenate reductase family protein [Halocola ammonii]
MKFFYLKTCDTCKRIMNDLDIENRAVDLREIKSENVSPEELDQMKKHEGSYESLFNKRARKYREQKLNERELSEDDFRQLILDEYTFLKRPVLLSNDRAFAGNSKKVIAEAQQYLDSSK